MTWMQRSDAALFNALPYQPPPRDTRPTLVRAVRPVYIGDEVLEAGKKRSVPAWLAAELIASGRVERVE